MAGKNEVSMVRIDKDAHEKLKIVARRKHCTITALLGWLIDNSYHEGSNVFGTFADELKSIRTDLNLVSMKATRIAGATERTESFIKTLLNQDRPVVQNSPVGSVSSDSQMPGYDDSSVPALTSLLGRLLDKATRTKNFDGTQAMQIRISVDEFARIQHRYDELCTLRNT